MATTAVIVEVLVIGVLALPWLAVLLLGVTGGLPAPAEVDRAVTLLKSVGEAPTALVVAALCYALGSLVDAAASFLSFGCYERWERHRWKGRYGKDYDAIRLAAYKAAGPDLVPDLIADKGAIRMTRATALNLAALGVALHFVRLPIASLLPLVWVAACFIALLAYWRLREYYSRLLKLGDPQNTTPPS